ncbi:class I SAM-dependent methyltransferase [Candidatus Parcubacteria bacterium]|nr:MAG: class I SAM-dependent methyltransferase [Candidatus Parcubacteria bacterium]
MTKKTNFDNQQNLSEEKRWHEQSFYLDSGHWTSLPMFASRERHWLHNDVQTLRFYNKLFNYIKMKPYRDNASILLAPIGNGKDAFYIRGVFKGIQEIHGIDISPLCLAACPGNVITKEADILFSGYVDHSFNVIVCSQFLHHIHAVGFDPFIHEFYRLLQKGGTLAILEPSSLYPFGLITAFARKLMGNVTGLVEGERPISPQLLTDSLMRAGFVKIRLSGLVFTHVRFPTLVQHMMDAVDYPFRVLPPFRSFANSVGWFCTKP